MIDVDKILLIGSFLIFASITASSFYKELNIPILLVCFAVSMIAGSYGIELSNKEGYDVQYIKTLGSITLCIVLFLGGLETNIDNIKPILYRGIALSTLGVLLTSVTLGVIINFFTNFDFSTSMLFSSVVASTDAAAVFTILKSQNLKIKNTLSSLLEFESGSNDPMAYFLVISFISFSNKTSQQSIFSCIMLFLQGLILGLIIGFYMGYCMQSFISKIELDNKNFYPVFALSMVMFTYAMTNLINGNGLLAVYIAGILLGKKDFLLKEQLIWFFNGISWIFQMIMFISIGLLVSADKLKNDIIEGVMISFFSIFVSRPISVFISLYKSEFSFKEKIFLSFVGLRGATSIVFATYPFNIDDFFIPHATKIFNIVFIIVVISFLFQGFTIPYLAKYLKLEEKT